MQGVLSPRSWAETTRWKSARSLARSVRTKERADFHMAHAEAFSVERTLCKTQRRECALCSANRRHARLSSLGRAEPQRALVRVQQSSLRCARAELLPLRPLLSYATTCHRHCGTRLQVLVCLEQRAISARIIARRALEQLALHVRATLFTYPCPDLPGQARIHGTAAMLCHLH